MRPVSTTSCSRTARPRRPPRLTGAARSAGPSGVGAVRRRMAHKSPSSGPPESTISLPTRTFRAGSRQRMMLAVLLAALLLLLLTVAGVWALLGQQGGGTPGQAAGQNEQAGGGGPQKSKEEPGKGAGGEVRNPSGGSGSWDGTKKENGPPAPPLVRA